MFVSTYPVIYLGAKKDLTKNDRQFSLYQIYDPASQESATIFASDNSLDVEVKPMDHCICVIDVRGKFLNLKSIRKVTKDNE